MLELAFLILDTSQICCGPSEALSARCTVKVPSSVPTMSWLRAASKEAKHNPENKSNIPNKMGLCKSPTLKPCSVLIWKRQVQLCSHSCDHSYSVRSELGKWTQTVKTAAENGSLDTSQTTLHFCRRVCLGSPITSPQLKAVGWEKEQKHAPGTETHTTPGPWQRAGFLYKQDESTTKVFWITLCNPRPQEESESNLFPKKKKNKKTSFHCSCCKKAFKHILHCYKQRALSQHSHRTASAFFCQWISDLLPLFILVNSRISNSCD